MKHQVIITVEQWGNGSAQAWHQYSVEYDEDTTAEDLLDYIREYSSKKFECEPGVIRIVEFHKL